MKLKAKTLLYKQQKIRRRPKQVATYEFSIDAIEEWDASLEGIDILHAKP